MASKLKSRKDFRKRRHCRLRRKVMGDAQRPRMCVTVSNRWIRVQLIDDETATTMMALCSRGLDGGQAGKTLATAKRMGEDAARKALEKGVRTVVFDRGGRKYHGRLKALAEAARESGLRL